MRFFWLSERVDEYFDITIRAKTVWYFCEEKFHGSSGFVLVFNTHHVSVRRLALNVLAKTSALISQS